jgi:hypothetical protein
MAQIINLQIWHKLATDCKARDTRMFELRTNKKGKNRNKSLYNFKDWDK